MKLPQLTLRDLFWLVLVVGMGCAWWLDRRRAETEIAKLESEVRLVQPQPSHTELIRRAKLRAKELAAKGVHIDIRPR